MRVFDKKSNKRITTLKSLIFTKDNVWVLDLFIIFLKGQAVELNP